MRYLSLALVVCLGCPSHPSAVGSATSAATTSAPSASASSAASAEPSAAPSATAAVSGPKWLEAAARAPAPLADAARREYATGGSPFRHDDQIHPVLDRVASQAPTAAGLRAAAKILEKDGGVGGDMAWTGSGTSPAAKLVYAAGVALLADLVVRACAATPKDAAIGLAIESIPIPSIDSSLRDRTAAENERDALRVAGADCGLKSKRPTRRRTD